MECISESSADSEDEIKPLRHTKRQRKISESSSTSESDQVAKPNTRKPEIHAGNNSYQASRKRCKARTRTRSRSRPGSVSGSQSDQSNSGGVGNESTFKTPNCRRSSRKAAIAAKASLAQSQSLEELDDGDNIDKNVVTPVSEGMKVHMNSSSNPRSSSRLRLSHDKKGSMKLPDRKKVLEAISPCTSSMKRAQQYQPKKLVNNFIKE